MTSNQRAPRFVRNPSGYHSHGKTHKEKVYNLGVHIKEFGWEGTWKQPEGDDVLKATMKRGDSEIIKIWWPDSQWWPDVYYTYAGNEMKCRNISHAAKLASEKPDPDKMRRNASRKNGRKSNGIAAAFAAGASNMGPSADDLIASLATTLPFDRESTPDDIKAVLKTKVNPTIVWINRLSGCVEQDYIKTWSRHLKVTANKEGKLIINFVGGHQFHSVYLDSVIGLG